MKLIAEDAYILNKARKIRKIISDTADVDAFSDSIIRDNSALDETPKKIKPLDHSRFFKDNIWGAIHSSYSISIIDRIPFFTRLKKYSKLPLASQVYPDANHSTQQHIYGGMHWISMVIDSKFDPFRENSSKIPMPEVLSEYLLHTFALRNIGHLPYDYLLNDIIIQNIADIDFMLAGENLSKLFELLNNFYTDLSVSESMRSRSVKTLSSLLIFCSKCFSDLYQPNHIRDFISQNSGEYEPVDFLISGLLNSNLFGMQNLIHDLFDGPYSGRVIDGLLRDSKSCGINIPLDIDRILHSVDIATKQHLSENNFHIVSNDGYYLLVDFYDAYISLEWWVSTEIFHLRVESHPWIILSEKVFKNMLAEYFKKSINCTININDFYLGTEESFLFQFINHKSKSVKKPALRIANRATLKRSLHISADTICDVDTSMLTQHENEKKRQEDIKKELVKKIKANMGMLHEEEILIDAIKKNVNIICEILRKNDIKNIDIPNIDPDILLCHNKNANNYLSNMSVSARDAQEIRRTNIDKHPYIKVDIQANNDNFTIYTQGEYTHIVAIAANLAFYELLPPVKAEWDHRKIYKYSNTDLYKSSQYCGLDTDLINTIINELAANSSFFDNYPELIPLNQEQTQRAKNIAQRFSSYGGENKFRVCEESVTGFMCQFPFGLRDHAIQLIEEIKFLNRPIIEEFFGKTVSEHAVEREEEIVLCPLTSSSGNLIESLIGDSLKQNYKMASNFKEAVDSFDEETHKKIVLFDDNLISGSQATTQIKAWLNMNVSGSEKRNIDEKPLSEAQRRKIKGIEIGFSFIVAHNMGVNILKDNCQKFCFGKGKIVINRFYSFDEVSGKSICNNGLKQYLEDVGFQVYKQKKADMPVEMIRNRALGFDNLEGLFVTMFNCPSSIYTAIWCPGEFEKKKGIFRPWRPLFIRKNNHKNLVMS